MSPAAAIPPTHPSPFEVALLVEDAWQHRGVGIALLRRLVSPARADVAAVLLHTHADNAPMMRTIRRVADGLTGEPAYDRDGGVVTVTLALSGRRVPT